MIEHLPPLVRSILLEEAARFNLTPEAILSPSRPAWTYAARKAVMRRLRSEPTFFGTVRSYSLIASYLNRHRKTIMHACRGLE